MSLGLELMLERVKVLRFRWDKCTGHLRGTAPVGAITFHCSFIQFYKQISFIFCVNFRIGLTKAPHHSPKQNENQNCCYFNWDHIKCIN